MKSKREQILELCETDMDYYKSKPHKSLDRLIELQPIITALLDRVEQLEGALDFYANPDNYDTTAHGKTNIIEDDCSLNSREPFLDRKCGGRRARQTLATSPLDKLLEGEK